MKTTMKVIITGTTGMVGKGVLLECLDHAEITEVLSISRKPIGFKQAYMFRPGAIIPLRGIQPSSKLYRVLINNLKWLLKLIKRIAPYAVVDTTQMGLAMINVTKKGYEKKVLKPRDIQILAE